jgi:histone-lysine N-methyltransferase SETMAR
LSEYDENTVDFLDSIVTGDETWCHYVTPETKQQSRLWKHTGSPPPKKFKQQLSAGKIMASVFWDRRGVLLIEFMPRGTTINSTSYCKTSKKLRRAIQNRRRGKLSMGVRLHHDNARPHVSQQTKELIDNFGWDVIDHPPYSPDLAPSDFHLFPKLKEHLGGQRFQTDEELQEEVSKSLIGLAADFFEAGMQKWITRQQKFIEKNGDYVEK